MTTETPLRALERALVAVRESSADDVHTLGSLLQLVQVLELAPDQRDLARESMQRSLRRLFETHGARLADLQALADLIMQATGAAPRLDDPERSEP